MNDDEERRVAQLRANAEKIVAAIRRESNAELVDAIERAWLSRFGYVPVVVEVYLAKIRGG